MHVRPVYAGGLIGGRSQLPCKRWACADCGPGRRAEALKHLRGGVTIPGSVRFLTVTFPRQLELRKTPEHVKIVNRAVSRFVQMCRRHYGGAQYAKTLEVTKMGRLHVHALVRGVFLPKCTDLGRRRHGLPTGKGSGSLCYCAAGGVICTDARCRDRRHHLKPCIQALAWRAGLGFVDIRRVESAEVAAAYLSKYLFKASEVAGWPRYSRRYSASRHWSPRTMGQIHAEWVEGLRARGLLAPPGPPVLFWLRVPPPARRPAWRSPPEPWWPVDPDTGEILPVPF